MKSILIALALLSMSGVTLAYDFKKAAPELNRTTARHAQQAVMCANRLGSKPDTIIVIDMSRPASSKRLWAFDIKGSQPRLILNDNVAHGRGSDPRGTGIPESFSNVPGSLATSLGLYSVAEAYEGKAGDTRRRLDGMMVGWNDNARQRAVVMHQSNYVKTGWAGRSEGCPAVSVPVMEALEDHGLNNAIMWIDGNDRELHEAIASCSQTKTRHRFRWFWQPKVVQHVAPPIYQAFNPYWPFIRNENMCSPRPDLAFERMVVFANPIEIKSSLY